MPPTPDEATRIYHATIGPYDIRFGMSSSIAANVVMHKNDVMTAGDADSIYGAAYDSRFPPRRRQRALPQQKLSIAGRVGNAAS